MTRFYAAFGADIPERKSRDRGRCLVYTMRRHLAVNQIGAFLLNKAGITDASQISKNSDLDVSISFPQPNGLTLKILAFPDMPGILDSKLPGVTLIEQINGHRHG